MGTPIDLTTLARATAWIPNAGTTNNAEIASLITAYSRAILKYLGRPQLSATSYTETRTGHGTTSIMPANYPVQSVQSLYLSGYSVPASVIAPPQPPTNGFLINRQTMAIDLLGFRQDYGPGAVTMTYVAGYLDVETGAVPSTGPYVFTPSYFWQTDQGVKYANGTALTPVASAPAAGQYVPPAPWNAVNSYTFAAADAGQTLSFAYGTVPEDVVQACNKMVGNAFAERSRIGIKSQTLAQQVVVFDLSAVPASILALLDPYRAVWQPI